MRALRSGDITSSGRLVCVVSKTGRLFDCQLPVDAVAAIEATWPERRALIFPLSRKTCCRWWKEACRLAGCPGTPKWLRRSGATAVESQRPGSAKEFLGHATDGLAARHYIDPRQLPSTRPRRLASATDYFENSILLKQVPIGPPSSSAHTAALPSSSGGLGVPRGWKAGVWSCWLLWQTRIQSAGPIPSEQRSSMIGCLRHRDVIPLSEPATYGRFVLTHV